MCVCVHIYIYMHTYIYVYIHMYIYIYTYVYIHMIWILPKIAPSLYTPQNILSCMKETIGTSPFKGTQIFRKHPLKVHRGRKREMEREMGRGRQGGTDRWKKRERERDRNRAPGRRAEKGRERPAKRNEEEKNKPPEISGCRCRTRIHAGAGRLRRSHRCHRMENKRLGLKAPVQSVSCHERRNRACAQAQDGGLSHGLS